MRTEGVKGFNLFAVEKLAINVATIERFAGRCVHETRSGGEQCVVQRQRTLMSYVEL
jgi:hypothetical protein